MLNILISFLLLNLGLAQGSEIYYVVHSKGKVIDKKTKELIKVGSKIATDAQLQFGDANAALMVISTKRGRYTIQPKKAASGAKASTELLAVFVKDALLPVKTRTELSTRGAEDEAQVNLKDYFGSESFMLLGNKPFVIINTSKYPITDTKFFIFRYIHKGEPVNKRIKFNGDTLFLERDVLMKKGEQVINPENLKEAEIYYSDTETKYNNKVASFKPVFVGETYLKEQTDILIKMLKEQNSSKEQSIEEVTVFLQDLYGKLDKAQVKQWIERNYQL